LDGRRRLAGGDGIGKDRVYASAVAILLRAEDGPEPVDALGGAIRL
jgi:hypothetical protein